MDVAVGSCSGFGSGSGFGSNSALGAGAFARFGAGVASVTASPARYGESSSEGVAPTIVVMSFFTIVFLLGSVYTLHAVYAMYTMYILYTMHAFHIRIFYIRCIHCIFLYGVYIVYIFLLPSYGKNLFTHIQIFNGFGDIASRVFRLSFFGFVNFGIFFGYFY